MTESYFAPAPRIPKDAIFALTAQFKSDKSPVKANLGQGTYRDDEGQPWILPSVARARQRVQDSKQDHEYLPILGHPEFRRAAADLVLGPNFDSLSSRGATSQSLSGTGGLHLAGSCLRAYSSLKPIVYIPSPTWSNHHLVFSTLGFKCQSFSYFDFGNRCIDMDAYRRTLQTAEPHSIFILHACAHNPSGCDPTKEQWHEIGRIMKKRQLFPLFDAAYLGFNSGSVDDDAYAIRYFVNELQMETAIAVSFAKNMGLYGERVGATIFVTQTEDVAMNVESVFERLQRSEVSNPPAYGAKIASTILNDDELRAMWYQDLITMCDRIRSMRKALWSLLRENNAPGQWSHIVSQTGMFSFLGLSPEIVTELKEKYHVYMADNSRISIAGLNSSNVAYVAQSILECVRNAEDRAKSRTNPRISSVL